MLGLLVHVAVRRAVDSRRCCSACRSASSPRRCRSRPGISCRAHAALADAARVSIAVTALAAARRHGVDLGGASAASGGQLLERLGVRDARRRRCAGCSRCCSGSARSAYLLVGDGALRAAGVRGIGGGGAPRARVADRPARGRAARASRAGRSAFPVQQSEFDRRADRARSGQGARGCASCSRDFLRDSLTLGERAAHPARARGGAGRAVPDDRSRCDSGRGWRVTTSVAADGAARAGAAADPAAARRECRAARHRDAPRRRDRRDRGAAGRRARRDRRDRIRATRTASRRGTGFGLDIVRRRLAATFGDRAALAVEAGRRRLSRVGDDCRSRRQRHERRRRRAARGDRGR